MGVDPKVHLEFSIRCWMLWKNANKLFDQPNINKKKKYFADINLNCYNYNYTCMHIDSIILKSEILYNIVNQLYFNQSTNESEILKAFFEVMNKTRIPALTSIV